MIHTLGTEFVHFYLLEEDGELTLVDAGVAGYRASLEAELAFLGRSPGDLRAIVLTHADPDHVGFAGELQAEYGTPVHVHRADAERTRLGKLKKAEGSPLAMLGMLRHGHSRRVARHMLSNGGAKQPPVPVVIPFDDGDELDLPGRLRVIHTPGHSEGHSSLLAPAADALFVGDAITAHDVVTGAPGARVTRPAANTSTVQAYESLARIEALDPATLYFGHGDPTTRSAA